MITSLSQAVGLILSGNRELIDILLTTAKMSISSSLISLILGVPVGLVYGSGKFPGRNTLIVLNRTLTGMPPVVCGLLFYMLFSGVGPFRRLHLMFSVELMILAQIALITPLVINVMETYVSSISAPVKETCRGLGFSRFKAVALLVNESRYQIFSAFLTAFGRSIAEVGAVSMVGGAIAWKTNVMTTAIMQYTNRGNFSLGVALGIILLSISLVVNVIVSIMQRRFSK